jgi:2-amino-4-hydroxy-6-hydroxymethyldihydropteridine diphosphokinase
MEYGLSLGSNMGDRLAHLQSAQMQISKLSGISHITCSPIYETAAVGVRPEYQDMAYLNAVLVVTAAIEPKVLSDAIHAIEDDLGRVRTEDQFAPRPIDIDILYAGETLSEDDDLTLPHPRWAERRFVVQPLADVRPDLVFPGDNSTVREVLSQLPADPAVRCYSKEW